MITISDSTIDVPMASLSWRVDTMPKNDTFDRITSVFDIISSLPHELTVGVSMMLSDIVPIMYYKVFENANSLGLSIFMVKL